MSVTRRPLPGPDRRRPRGVRTARSGRGSGSGRRQRTSCSGTATPTSRARRSRRWSAQFNATHPNIHVTAQFYGNSDYALQKVLDRDRRRQAARHLLPVRLLGGEHRQEPEDVDLNDYIKDDQSFNWNDFWPAERAGGDRERQDRRHPGAGRQPRARLQQEALRRRPAIPTRRRTGRGTDFAAAAQKLTDPAKKQFGWAYVNDAERGHRLALRGAAVAGGRRDPHARRQARRVRLARRPEGARRCCRQMAVRTTPSTSTAATTSTRPVQLRQYRHAVHRPLGPVAVPERATTACRSCPAT